MAAKKMAAEYKMDYLGAPGWITQIRLQADNGRPTVVSDPDVAALYKWRGPQGRHHRGGPSPHLLEVPDHHDARTHAHLIN
jgi:hypothetical protein